MYQKFNISQQTYVWIILISIVLIRLMFLGAYPLADTTEARYGEMGRLIIDTGDWITPQISQGVPFWGKPPLSFWLTATSFMLLGINEFAARLPSLLLAVAVIVMVWSTGRFQTNKKTALTACVIMASSIIFWISSGAVMTDQCLMTGTTLSMIAFWHCFKTSGKHAYWWGILFFIGLAIGLMSKGPVAGVLIFLPVIIWSLFGKTPFFTLKRLPWLTGCIIIIVLVVPWYWLAEIKTPGFLEYFFIGEHWNRFLVPGWKGDLYGSAHSQTKGMIWVFWLICAFPWSFIFLFSLKSKTIRQHIITQIKSSNGWHLYLVLWATAPMLFFSMASNILWAYVLPGIPAFSLFTAEILSINPKNSHGKILKRTSVLMILLFFIASSIIALPDNGHSQTRRSQKHMIQTYNMKYREPGTKLSYLFKRPFSAEFYSKESAAEIKTVSQITELFKNDYQDYFAVKKKYIPHIPAKVINRFEKLEEINGYYLFKENN